MSPRDPSTVTNAEFLRELSRGASKGSVLWVTAFSGNPAGNPGWGGAPWEGPTRDDDINACTDLNAYFSTAALRMDPVENELKRRLTHFDRLLSVVVDDPDVTELSRPSWVLRTSPGKHQVGLFLDRDDPDCADVRKVTALVTALHRKGLIGGDKSGNNAVRYVRLPQGQNQKPRESGHWQCQLLTWDPEARYTLEDAAAILGINLAEVLTEAATAPVSTGAFTGEQDEKLSAATADIIEGNNLHEACNTIAASLVASGAHPGAVVNQLKALMNASAAPRDARWQARFADIYRSVESAHKKFSQPSVARGNVDGQTGEETDERMFRHVGELLGNMKPANFIVDNHLESDSLSLMFGPPGCGKSFAAIDIACSIATGQPWHGVNVKQGLVISVIGEGHHGYARRLAAWGKHRNLHAELAKADLYVSKHSVRLGDPHAALALAAEIDRIVTELGGRKPTLIIVDTLARNFGEGDENSAKDMSRFVANVDMYLRGRYGAHTLVVHHSGHDAERARGSSALKGALDQEFKVEGYGGRLTITCTKMKEAEAPPPRRFKILKVEVGRDKGDIAIESACLVLDGNPLEVELMKSKDGPITAGDVVKAFLDIGPEHGKQSLSVALGCGASSADKILKDMAKRGLIEKSNRNWALSPLGLEQAANNLWFPKSESP